MASRTRTRPVVHRGGGARRAAVQRWSNGSTPLRGRPRTLAGGSFLLHFIALCSLFQGWGSQQWLYVQTTEVILCAPNARPLSSEVGLITQGTNNYITWNGASLFDRCLWNDNPYYTT